MDDKTEQLADNIVRRANALNISIAKLCREAGVSRRWFEYFKQRTPKAVATYVKIEQLLIELERDKKMLQEVVFTCPRTHQRRKGVIQRHHGVEYVFCPDTNNSYATTSVIDIEYCNPTTK